MAADVFGDLSLFDEFEKDRSSNASFITYDTTADGTEDKSKILFQTGTSDDDSSSESEDSDSESGEENENRKADEENDQTKDNTDVKSTTYKLQHDRNKYKRFANLIDSTRHVQDTESPACQIIFHNNSFSRKYRAYIENFLTGLFYKDQFDNSQLPELDLEPTRMTCVDINEKLKPSQRSTNMWQAHAIIGCGQFHKNFQVDTLGWPLVNLNPSLTDSWEVPKFDQCFLEPLPFDEDESVRSRPERPKASCFNCGGEHMIMECPEPKDFQRIKKNKAEFLEKNPQNQKLAGSRYHKDEDPRFVSFKPGQISDKLREALGLSPRHIPLYVYRMRLLGYPPGWLEAAKKQVSGLSLFDKHGKEVDITGQSMEDGEVNEERQLPPQIDTEKIIEYPGFTVELDEGMIDEHEEFSFPPIQPHQLKSALIQQQEMMDQMRKRQLEEGEEHNSKRLKIDHADMDLDESQTNGEHQSPQPYSSSPVGRSNKRIHTPIPGHPPLPCDTPPGKPPLPDGTPPPTPEEYIRRRRGPPLPGEPPLPENTPPTRPPLPKGTPPVTPNMPSPIHRQLSALSSKSGRSPSPSLEDLEKQYQLIQDRLAQDGNTDDVELQVVDSVGEDDDDEESINNSQDSAQSGGKLIRQESQTSLLTLSELGSGSPSGSLPGTPGVMDDDSATPSFKNRSISKDFGTPIFMKNVGREKLPTATSFGQGIEDHIPFENLPDATGSYSKMSKLIDRIRSRIKKKK